MSGVTLSNIDLSGTNLRYVNLKNVNWQEADLEHYPEHIKAGLETQKL